MIGTHALLEEKVQFADLGLVVVDEQHRFGVEQRDALRAKAADGRPHVLVMTATPIPRTVAMTVFGDLEMSTLTELPAGRSPIATHVVPAAEKPHYLERVWERMREEVAAGRQAYVVCPRIGGEPGDEAGDPGDATTARARTTAARTTRAARPPRRRARPRGRARAGPAGRAAGRGPARPAAADEKDEVMRAFAAGEVDVLVATTVVEVGVDVPNATAMVIMDADRFGVSQLHQLRGRVGRGGHAGLCLLVTEAEADSPAASGSTRWPRRSTGSSCPGSTSSSAARATCSAPPRPGRRSSLSCCAAARRGADRPARGRGRPSSSRPIRRCRRARAGRRDRACWSTQERAEFLEKA